MIQGIAHNDMGIISMHLCSWQHRIVGCLHLYLVLQIDMHSCFGCFLLFSAVNSLAQCLPSLLVFCICLGCWRVVANSHAKYCISQAFMCRLLGVLLTTLAATCACCCRMNMFCFGTMCLDGTCTQMGGPPVHVGLAAACHSGLEYRSLGYVWESCIQQFGWQVCCNGFIVIQPMLNVTDRLHLLTAWPVGCRIGGSLLEKSSCRCACDTRFLKHALFC